jgi:hypothetical protein
MRVSRAWCLSLVSFAFTGANSAVYDVAASSQLPTLGAANMNMQVEVLEVERYENGSRLLRLAVEPGTRITNRHSRGDDLDMHSFPAFFTQADDGTLLEFQHHKNEASDTVGHKKMLASYWQFPRTWPSNRRWRKLDADANGPHSSEYALHSRWFRRQTITKEMEWHPTKSRPPELGFKMRSSLLAVVDAPTGVVRHIHSRLHVEASTEGHQLSEDVHGFSHEMDGLSSLPTGPSVVTWSLRPITMPPTFGEPSGHDRHLFNAQGQELPARSNAKEHVMWPTAADFVSSSIEHVSPRVSLE